MLNKLYVQIDGTSFQLFAQFAQICTYMRLGLEIIIKNWQTTIIDYN